MPSSSSASVQGAAAGSPVLLRDPQLLGGCSPGEQHVLAGILLAPLGYFCTKGQGRGMGRRNPNWKLLGSLVEGGNFYVVWQSPSVLLPAVAREVVLLMVWVLLAPKNPGQA